MVEKFLAKERKKISNTPHTGISEARFRLLNTQLRWVSEFVGDTRKEDAQDKAEHLPQL